MRFVGVKDLRYHPREIINGLAKDNEIVITMNGRPRAILTPVEDNSIESYIKAVRQAKALLAVNKMQGNSLKAGTDKITESEINKEISAVRKHRRTA